MPHRLLHFLYVLFVAFVTLAWFYFCKHLTLKGFWSQFFKVRDDDDNDSDD